MKEEKRPAPIHNNVSGNSSAGGKVWKLVGGAALVLVATGVIVSLKDIKRYIKMVRM
ncbi:MAG: hypothetical protein ABJB97_00140 [Acidobacteriota bacterium]